jgi:two-component system response regulator YesN
MRTAPQTICVLLSGYGDFSYAQRALRLGAYDYLLKPAAPEALLQVLSRAKSRLLQGEKRKGDDLAVRARLSISLSGYAEHFYRQLLGGELTPPEIAEKLQFLQSPNGEVEIILVSLDDMFSLKSSEVDCAALRCQLREHLQLLLTDVFTSCPPVVEMEAGIFALVLEAPRLPDRRKFALKIWEETSKACGRGITVSTGDRVKLPRAAAAYHIARSKLDARFLHGGNRVVTENTPESAARAEIPSDVRRSMQRSARFGDFEQYRRCLRELMSALETHSLSRFAWQLFALEVCDYARELVRELGLPQPEELQPITLNKKIEALTTISDVRVLIEQTMAEVIDKIARSTSGRSIAVRKALAFMADHLIEDLKLNEVARAVNLTPNYLSQIFRSETGMTFIEHRSRFRVAAAKELLSSGALNVSEIAYRVGFGNPRHFSRIFARLEGMTPSIFRSHQVPALENEESST